MNSSQRKIELLYKEDTITISDVPLELKDFQALIIHLSFKTNLPEQFIMSYTTSEQAEELPIIDQQDYQELLAIDPTTAIKVFLKDNMKQRNSLSFNYDIIDDDFNQHGLPEKIQAASEIEILPKIPEHNCSCSSDEQQQRIRKIVEEVLKEKLPSIIAQVKEAVIREQRSPVSVVALAVQEEKAKIKNGPNDRPSARFGHTITQVSKNKAVFFGGATGNNEKYLITGETFVFDCATQRWSKLKPSGSCPTQRAAHAATTVELNQLVVYGGATGGGGLVPDDLYLLDLTAGEEKAQWILVSVVGTTPGRRYGHSIVFSKPYLIVFGGNTGKESVNDVWILNVEKAPMSWAKLQCSGEVPPARVYHSAALCSAGSSNGMMVIFGGRTAAKDAANDTWGLRRHRNGSWDWMRAPYKPTSEAPIGRYQHSAEFKGSKMIIVGGRTTDTQNEVPMEVYDCEASDWSRHNSITRFRHSCFLSGDHLYVYGGFDNNNPNLPTDTLLRSDIQELDGRIDFSPPQFID